MKVRLKWYLEDTAVWLDWEQLLPRWRKSEYFLDPKRIVHAYPHLWFNTNEQPPLFEIGELFECPFEVGFAFSNGRNRTTLLHKYLNHVPIALSSCAQELNFIQAAIIRPIEKDEILDLPNLPILDYPDIRKLAKQQSS